VEQDFVPPFISAPDCDSALLRHVFYHVWNNPLVTVRSVSEFRSGSFSRTRDFHVDLREDAGRNCQRQNWSTGTPYHTPHSDTNGYLGSIKHCPASRSFLEINRIIIGVLVDPGSLSREVRRFRQRESLTLRLTSQENLSFPNFSMVCSCTA